MSDGGGTDPGFVRERSTLEAHHQHAHQPAVRRVRREGSVHNRGERCRHFVGVHQHNRGRRQYIDAAHKRYDPPRRGGNPPDSSDNHDPHQKRHDQPVDPTMVIQKGDRLAYGVQRLVYLERVAAGKGTSNAQDGKYDSQDPSHRRQSQFAQAPRQVEHGTAHDSPVRARLAVLLAQRAFRKLR